MKRVLSFLLVMVMTATAMLLVVPPLEVSAATTLTENAFAEKIEELQARYPHKQYWNDYNGTETIDGRTTSKAGPIACTGTRTDSAHYGQKCTTLGFCYICTCKCGKFVGEQCYGFANLMAYHTFGSYAISSGSANTGKGWNKSTSVSTFYAGDVVRIDGDAHSIFIHKVTDTDVYYVDCNSGVPCQIEWNNKISISNLKSRTTYVVRMSGNTLKGTGESSINTLTVKYNANGGSIGYPVEIGTNYKVYTTDGSYAIVRSGPGSNYGEVTRFASGTIVTVIETQKKSDYTWGKIKYDKEAWVALGSWMIQMGTAYDHSYYLSSSVVYDSNNSQPVTTTLKYGEELKNGLCNDTTLALYRDGYNFLGWSLTADGSDTIIDQDKAIKPEEIVPEIANGSKTVTMYAIWEKVGCDHSYTYKSNSTGHWKECTLCGDKLSTSSHTYSNSCDRWCDVCAAERTITHTYTNSCDTSCNVCGETRTISHSFGSSYEYNNDKHWKNCTICGSANTSSYHYYTNDCDTTCNSCGYERTAPHIYTYDCDTDCNECGYIREAVEEHLWMPPSPTDESTHTCPCQYCEAVSVRQHVYTNACDNSCNHCKYERTTTHTYDNDCDTNCNVCGETRSTQHVYDDEHDAICNICNEVRTIETLPITTPDPETNPSTKPNVEPNTEPNTNSNNQSNSKNEDDDDDINQTTVIIIAGAVTLSAISIFGTALIMKKKR